MANGEWRMVDTPFAARYSRYCPDEPLVGRRHAGPHALRRRAVRAGTRQRCRLDPPGRRDGRLGPRQRRPAGDRRDRPSATSSIGGSVSAASAAFVPAGSAAAGGAGGSARMIGAGEPGRVPGRPTGSSGTSGRRRRPTAEGSGSRDAAGEFFAAGAGDAAVSWILPAPGRPEAAGAASAFGITTGRSPARVPAGSRSRRAPSAPGY